ncbi:MAG: carbohydrate kinase [Clostridia bacterium]|nr:carbohydrate kinase [Clostridia bacterium]
MNQTVDVGRIIERLKDVEGITVAVFGDYCLDKYIYSDPARDEYSVETDLIARQFDRKKTAPGAGGTITNNLRVLGVKVLCVGMTGDDGEGWELRRELAKIGADTTYLYKAEEVCTPTYMKPMILNPDGSYTEAGRLDFRNFAPPSQETEDRVLANLEKALNEADACLAVDQFFQRNSGIITDRVRAKFMELAKASGKPILADSRALIHEFTDTMIKCNNIELIKYFNNGEGDPEDPEQVIACGKRLYERSGNPAFITRGSEGMLVFDENGVTSVPAFKVEGPVDICGAGDASSAGIGTGCALGLSYAEAATLACCISSITIQQIGETGTASIPQIIERLGTRK